MDRLIMRTLRVSCRSRTGPMDEKDELVDHERYT